MGRLFWIMGVNPKCNHMYPPRKEAERRQAEEKQSEDVQPHKEDPQPPEAGRGRNGFTPGDPRGSPTG